MTMTSILLLFTSKCRCTVFKYLLGAIQLQLCNYSLQTWLSENSTQSLRPLNTIKLWFIQIVSAIGYLHGKSLVHRNLKVLILI